MGEENISLCMIVRNEEQRLGRCLDSVRDLASEVIIADTGSADATVAIAASFGAKVYAFDFTVVDFAAARNHALARANGRWILVLDADETLDASSAPLIRELAAGDENAGYYFERLNQRGSEAPIKDYAVRLFPNRPDYRYRGRVHETVDAAILAGGGRLVKTAVCIQHDFASDPESRKRRNLAYIAILKEEIRADPSDHSRLEFLAAEYHQLGMFDHAAEIAKEIARLRPLDAQAHLHAGTYHWIYKRDRERARADFREALRLRPDYAEAQAYLRAVEEAEDG
jgi:glycosyltransferase involved in cell wall biosynthesis